MSLVVIGFYCFAGTPAESTRIKEHFRNVRNDFFSRDSLYLDVIEGKPGVIGCGFESLRKSKVYVDEGSLLLFAQNTEDRAQLLRLTS